MSFYDEIEIEDMTWDPQLRLFHFPCPCGDQFEITIEDLMDGDEIGRCPSCSLIIRVIYEMDQIDLEKLMSSDISTEVSKVLA